MRRHRILPLALLLVLLLGGACSGGDDAGQGDAASGGDGSAGTSNRGDADAGATAGDAPGDESAVAEAVPGAAPVGQPLQAGRAVIATAELVVVVDDVEVATQRVVDVGTAEAGFLAAQEARLEDREVSITLRVPTERYPQALDDLGQLGEVVERRVDTDDVTEQVVDLEGRIASGRASVERVRQLLEESGDVVQLATVEGELARREAELESLLGQQRVLEDQVALATIRVELREEALEPEEDEEGPAGFLGGLREGWDAFVDAAAVGLTAVGFLLPFALPVSLAAALWLALRHRGGVRPAPPEASSAG